MTDERDHSVVIFIGGAAAALSILFLERASVATLAVSIGASPSIVTGLMALVIKSAYSLILIGAGVFSALLAGTVLNLILLAQPRASETIRTASVCLAAIPMFALIPVWFSLFGDGWLAGFGFLFVALFSYLVMTAADAIATSDQIRKMMMVYRPGRTSAAWIAGEFVLWTAKNRLLALLSLSIPFSVGAELIAGTGGLGDLATNVYRNGNFGQLAVIAAAYILLAGAVLGVAVLFVRGTGFNKERVGGNG